MVVVEVLSQLCDRTVDQSGSGGQMPTRRGSPCSRSRRRSAAMGQCRNSSVSQV